MPLPLFAKEEAAPVTGDGGETSSIPIELETEGVHIARTQDGYAKIGVAAPNVLEGGVLAAVVDIAFLP